MFIRSYVSDRDRCGRGGGGEHGRVDAGSVELEGHEGVELLVALREAELAARLGRTPLVGLVPPLKRRLCGGPMTTVSHRNMPDLKSDASSDPVCRLHSRVVK